MRRDTRPHHQTGPAITIMTNNAIVTKSLPRVQKTLALSLHVVTEISIHQWREYFPIDESSIVGTYLPIVGVDVSDTVSDKDRDVLRGGIPTAASRRKTVLELIWRRNGSPAATASAVWNRLRDFVYMTSHVVSRILVGR